MDAGELVKKKCVPCRGGIPPLEPAVARQLATVVPGWELFKEDTRIRRQMQFDTFPGAIDFVVKVADLAEREGHHPDFVIHHRNLHLVLYTHAIGGLHENDFIMAAKINELAGD
jgi:4a-hydroxytetrahydrobiopterin dehydratase